MTGLNLKILFSSLAKSCHLDHKQHIHKHIHNVIRKNNEHFIRLFYALQSWFYINIIL